MLGQTKVMDTVALVKKNIQKIKKMYKYFKYTLKFT